MFSTHAAQVDREPVVPQAQAGLATDPLVGAVAGEVLEQEEREPLLSR